MSIPFPRKIIDHPHQPPPPPPYMLRDCNDKCGVYFVW